jgi:hypothetical protein
VRYKNTYYFINYDFPLYFFIGKLKNGRFGTPLQPAEGTTFHSHTACLTGWVNIYIMSSASRGR